jgi:4-hydroxy-tetrahydrodipicolinate synthase
MNSGCYTAMVTPFDGTGVDEAGLARLADFQIQNGIAGLLAVGTTGESPTLAWEEHHRVVQILFSAGQGQMPVHRRGGKQQYQRGVVGLRGMPPRPGADAVLLVDPYYNGPSSLEIRKEYIAPVAAAFPDLTIIPYVIPGTDRRPPVSRRPGPAVKDHPNVNTVKEATGNLDNMRRTRKCCGPEFTIFSGDDGLTVEMMTDPGLPRQV